MTWKDMFEIEDHYQNEPYVHMRWDSPHKTPYHLVLKSNNTVIAKYRDASYAIKQAKRKFKRMMRKAEREILGK